MKHITEDIFKRQDKAKRHKPIEFDLYRLSEELFNEFDRIGMINRLKLVPQLGSIAVNHYLLKNRYDYVLLQIWLHKKAHDLVNETLEFSYASTMHKEDFSPIYTFPPDYRNTTIEEFLQTFTLVYNVGHCSNTFTSSRAMIYALKQSRVTYCAFESQFKDTRASNLLNAIIEKEDYHHFHLVNSILVLEQCNDALFSVQIAKELIFAYLGINDCSKKMHYVFNLFRRMRNLAITTFDLQLDHTPFRIRVTNDNSLKHFLKEYLARYNDNRKAIQIVNSLTKLLSTFIYDEEKRVIKSFYIAKGIGRKIIDHGVDDYYNQLFLNVGSPINKKTSSSLRIDSNCLKLTFDINEYSIAINLLEKLDHMNHVRAAIYNRHDGHSTLVVSVNKDQQLNISLQLRILKTVVSSLRKIDNIQTCDIRYLIVAKYFLSHFLSNRIIRINPTGDNNDVCAYCLKGFVNKRNTLDQHVKKYSDHGEKHEVENMRSCLQEDTKKDVSILIPASIIVFDANGAKTDVEFDGFIIHPYRKTQQVVFLEAKVSREAGHAESELKQKLVKLGFSVPSDSIIRSGNDAHYIHSI